MAGKKTAASKKNAVRSTAKLTTLDDFLGEEGKREAAPAHLVGKPYESDGSLSALSP